VSDLQQLVVTAAIYGTNRKLQGYWGNIPKPKGQVKCRKGLEWCAQTPIAMPLNKRMLTCIVGSPPPCGSYSGLACMDRISYAKSGTSETRIIGASKPFSA
jgi:hypothetical protein